MRPIQNDQTVAHPRSQEELRLARAREELHNRMRQQVLQRVQQTFNSHGLGQRMGSFLHPLNPGHGLRPAELMHQMGGHDAQAAQLWEQNHPGAMAGRAPIPAWVQRQGAFGQAPAAPAGQPSNFISLPEQPAGQSPGAVNAGGQNSPQIPIDAGGGPGNFHFRAPGPPVPVDVSHGFRAPGATQNGAVGGLIPLAPGVFLHPGTGEIHGLPTPGGVPMPGAVPNPALVR